MSLTLADVLREHWPSYACANRSRLVAVHYRAVDCVLSCRTETLGGQRFQCTTCGKEHFAYHSCNHRSCPQCGSLDQQLWTARQEARLLPVPYYMITFTVPSELRPMCKAHPRELYNILIKESAGALQDVIGTKLNGTAGFTSVLHTWTRQMQHHPHIHIIIPAVAYDKTADILRCPAKDSFLVHHDPLADRFRNRVRKALQENHPGFWRDFQIDAASTFCRTRRWVSDVKPVGQGKTAVRYLARYVQRSAFSPKRLFGYDARGNVLLAWTCSKTGKRGTLRLHPHEFIRRWLLHVLPKGFTRVRHYGFMSSAAKRARLRVRELLGGGDSEPAVVPPELPAFACMKCGGELQFVNRFDKQQDSRGPP